MNALYVVRNTFKAHGMLFEAGTVIDNPSSIKYFKSRLTQRDVIELRPKEKQNAMWLPYLEARSKKPLDARIYQVCEQPLPIDHPDRPVVPSPVSPEPPKEPVKELPKELATPVTAAKPAAAATKKTTK
jgi:hypothetical protein